MEAFQQALSSARQVRDTIAGRFHGYFDVSEDVADDVQQNESLRLAIAKTHAANAKRVSELRGTLVESQERFKTRKDALEQTATPLIAAYDRLSVATTVYEETGKDLGELNDKIAHQISQEVLGYGYQSKLLSSLALGLRGLKARVAAGQPFAAEIHSIKTDLDTLNVPSAVASGVPTTLAATGLPSRSDFESLGTELWLSAERDHAEHVQHHVEEQSWLEYLKFSNVKPVGLAKSAIVAASSDPSPSMTAATTLPAAALRLRRGIATWNMDEIVEAADHVLQMAPEDAETVRTVARKLRQGAYQHLLVDTMVCFTDSLLVERAASMVEPAFTAPRD